MRDKKMEKIKIEFLRDLIDLEKKAAYSDSQGKVTRIAAVERLVDKLLQKVEDNETKEN